MGMHLLSKCSNDAVLGDIKRWHQPLEQLQRIAAALQQDVAVVMGRVPPSVFHDGSMAPCLRQDGWPWAVTVETFRQALASDAPITNSSIRDLGAKVLQAAGGGDDPASPSHKGGKAASKATSKAGKEQAADQQELKKTLSNAVAHLNQLSLSELPPLLAGDAQTAISTANNLQQADTLKAAEVLNMLAASQLLVQLGQVVKAAPTQPIAELQGQQLPHAFKKRLTAANKMLQDTLAEVNLQTDPIDLSNQLHGIRGHVASIQTDYDKHVAAKEAKDAAKDAAKEAEREAKQKAEAAQQAAVEAAKAAEVLEHRAVQCTQLLADLMAWKDKHRDVDAGDLDQRIAAVKADGISTHAEWLQQFSSIVKAFHSLQMQQYQQSSGDINVALATVVGRMQLLKQTAVDKFAVDKLFAALEALGTAPRDAQQQQFWQLCRDVDQLEKQQPCPQQANAIGKLAGRLELLQKLAQDQAAVSKLFAEMEAVVKDTSPAAAQRLQQLDTAIAELEEQVKQQQQPQQKEGDTEKVRKIHVHLCTATIVNIPC